MSITIGAYKGTIIGSRRSGDSLSTYWASLISATVENAAPTHVVLTFPTANPTLGASDFTIAGFTISSASWVGAVLTLVLSYPVTVFNGNLTITFGKTSETATVTNNVNDGKTVGWFAVGDGGSTYMTKDVDSYISSWKDLSGNNNHLLNAAGKDLPKYENGIIIFNGGGDYLKTSPFTYNQPECVYLVINQKTFTHPDFILDGNSADTMVFQQFMTSPNLYIYAGSAVGPLTTLPINTWAIIRLLYNGAGSKIILNETAPVTGNAGTSNAGGITLGSKANGTNASNILIKEAIFRNNADDNDTSLSIYNYLKNKYGFF